VVHGRVPAWGMQGLVARHSCWRQTGKASRQRSNVVSPSVPSNQHRNHKAGGPVPSIPLAAILQAKNRHCYDVVGRPAPAFIQLDSIGRDAWTDDVGSLPVIYTLRFILKWWAFARARKQFSPHKSGGGRNGEDCESGLKDFNNPLEVRPDRWLGPEHNGGINIELWKGSFIPFQNGGRRVCMGQQMALTEAKVVLAHLVPRLRFSLVPGQKVIRFPNVTIMAKNGILMTVEKVVNK